MFNSDVTFSKAFPLKGERRQFMFRAEMYNIFNHTQFTAANITPQYTWPLWQHGRPAADQRQPGPLHRRRQPAADVDVDALAVLMVRGAARIASPIPLRCLLAGTDESVPGPPFGPRGWIRLSPCAISRPDGSYPQGPRSIRPAPPTPPLLT